MNPIIAAQFNFTFNRPIIETGDLSGSLAVIPWPWLIGLVGGGAAIGAVYGNSVKHPVAGTILGGAVGTVAELLRELNQ